MTTIQVGNIVRLTCEHCQTIQADFDTADSQAVVLAIIPAKKTLGNTIPARAKLRWDDDHEAGCLLKYLELDRRVSTFSMDNKTK